MRRQGFHNAILFLMLTAMSADAQNAAIASKHRVHGKFLCQGEYSGLADQMDGPPRMTQYDNWSMYLMPDGSYRIEVKSVIGIKVDERYEFTRDMTPKFVLWTSPETGPDRGAEKLACEYQQGEIACQRDFYGQHASAKLRQMPPFSIDPGSEGLVVDMIWLMQIVTAQAARSPGQSTVIADIGIQDRSDGEAQLLAGEPIKVEYLGPETIEIRKRK